MFGSKIICNIFNLIKERIKACYHCFKYFSTWYKEKIKAFINYFRDIKYKTTNIKKTNFNLGLEHLHKNNLNDAILRFKLVEKFFA